MPAADGTGRSSGILITVERAGNTGGSEYYGGITWLRLRVGRVGL